MRPILVSAFCLLVLAAGTRPASAQAPAYTFAEESASGEMDVRAAIVTPAVAPARRVASIVFNYLDEDNHLSVEFVEGTVTLARIREGRRTIITGPLPCPELQAPGEHLVVIKRRDWSIRVLVDDHLVATARETFSPGDRAGYLAEGLQVTDLICQAIGELSFEDDFSRPPGEPDPWKPVRGTWQTILPESRSRASDQVHSANPFTYRATGDAALSLLSSERYPGASYWSDYELSASAKAADGALGLVFACRDADNCYLLRATPSATAGTNGLLELVKVTAGQESVLDSAPALLETGKWYRLTARFCEGDVEGLLDGALLCKAQDSSLCQGRIGLATWGCSKANFDDIALRSWRSAKEDFSTGDESCVESVGGLWRVRGGWLIGTATRGARYASCLLGGRTWRDYVVRAQIAAQSARAVGLYFACAGPEDYLLFRWGPDPIKGGEEVQQLWKVAAGKAALLTQRPSPLPRRDAFRLKVTADRGYLTVATDGATTLQAADVLPGEQAIPTTSSGGRIGFLAEGEPGRQAAFGDLRVSFCDPPAPPVTIASQFEAEDLMAAWARPAASWRALGNGLYTYALPVWGDFLLRFTLARLNPSPSAWTIGLRAARTAADLPGTADATTITAVAGARGLRCIAAGASGQAASDNDEPLLEIERRGTCLLARLDGVPFGWAQVPEGAEAPAVGLNLAGSAPSLNKAQLTSPNILDDAFSVAPVNWAPSAGTWDISDRWQCSPAWAWYCGREAPTPLTWHKRTVAGDMVAEFWAGVMMDGGPGGYQHPSDLNGVICGDGKSKDSGYAFIFAGDNNTATKLVRRGQVVASTPDVKFVNPTSGNSAFHNSWFHCRLEKIGGTLTFYVNGKQALQWTDPEPLEGGRFGIFTDQGNGILIARARLAFQRL